MYQWRLAIVLSDIKWIHIEVSSRCNAWCPACPRNQNGYGLKSGLIEQDLSVDKFQEIISKFSNLTGIQFCGNFGDPIACNHLSDLLEVAKTSTKKIQIHTNGGLRSTKWWEDLAAQLADIEHDVWFGIDGIDKIHEVYRQGTSYNKVIENAQAFINAGGYATWQFIPYKHNEHQLKECIRLSQHYKFSKFKIIKTFRAHKQQARNWRTGEEFLLEPSSVYQKVFFNPYQGIVKKENCMHIDQPSLYIDAAGKISPCCYFSEYKSFDSVEEMFYNLDIEKSLDNPDNRCLTSCGT